MLFFLCSPNSPPLQSRASKGNTNNSNGPAPASTNQRAARYQGRFAKRRVRVPVTAPSREGFASIVSTQRERRVSNQILEAFPRFVSKCRISNPQARNKHESVCAENKQI